MKKRTKHYYSIRSTSTKRNRIVQTPKDISALSEATGETGLTGGTRSIVTLLKRVTKKKKYMKSLDFSPFRKYPIPNQDKTIMGLNKYQCLHQTYLHFFL